MMKDVKRQKRYLSIFVLLVAQAACVNTPGIPEDHFYRLPDIPVVSSVELPGIITLGVAKIKADGLYRERAILYVEDSRPLELKSYHYRYWTHAPADLVQQHLIRYLRTVFPNKKIVRYSTGDPVDAVIYGRILRFERIIHNHNEASVMASLELAFQTVKDKEVDKLATQKEYGVQSEPARNEINQSVKQFSTALINNYRAFLSDIQLH